MSLSHIRQVRQQGGKPALVKVLVGNKPAWLPDGPDVVTVAPHAAVNQMDWIPLVGVWVVVHSLDGDEARALAVGESLERAGAKLFGATSPHFVECLTLEPTERARELLRADRGNLCAK